MFILFVAARTAYYLQHLFKIPWHAPCNANNLEGRRLDCLLERSQSSTVAIRRLWVGSGLCSCFFQYFCVFKWPLHLKRGVRYVKTLVYLLGLSGCLPWKYRRETPHVKVVDIVAERYCAVHWFPLIIMAFSSKLITKYCTDASVIEAKCRFSFAFSFAHDIIRQQISLISWLHRPNFHELAKMRIYGNQMTKFCKPCQIRRFACQKNSELFRFLGKVNIFIFQVYKSVLFQSTL